MADLTTRVLWINELFRLCSTDAADDTLIEHDDTTLEGVYHALTVGLDAAQEYLLACGMSDRWITQSAALTWSGTDETGGKYVALPTTPPFLRLDTTVHRPSLREADGTPWGQLVERDSRHAKGGGFYLQNDRLYLLRNAQVPATVYIDYIHRLEVPAADATVFTDFPARQMPLIPAFAAEYAMHQAWFPGGEEQRVVIKDNLMRRRAEAKWACRRTRQARRLRPQGMTGNHW